MREDIWHTNLGQDIVSIATLEHQQRCRDAAFAVETDGAGAVRVVCRACGANLATTAYLRRLGVCSAATECPHLRCNQAADSYRRLYDCCVLGNSDCPRARAAVSAAG